MRPRDVTLPICFRFGDAPGHGAGDADDGIWAVGEAEGHGAGAFVCGNAAGAFVCASTAEGPAWGTAAESPLVGDVPASFETKTAAAASTKNASIA